MVELKISLEAHAGKLFVRGPEWAGPVAEFLLAQKAKLLPLLVDAAPEPSSPDELPDDWREVYEERLSIMLVDGKAAIEHAEHQAFQDTLRSYRAAAIA